MKREIEINGDVPISSGQLLHNLILFGRLLRGLGIEINPGRMIEVVRALEHVEIGLRPDFYFTLRSLLITRQQDIELFEEAFDLFWKKPTDGGIDMSLQDLLNKQQQMMQQETETLVIPPQLEETTEEEQEEDEDAPDDEDELQEIIEVTRTYSAREVLARRDFGELTPAEVLQIKRLISRLEWRLGERETRRLRPGGGALLDMRRSIRRSFRYGGEILDWRYRLPKIKPRPLVVLADISGSMERYTRLLVHFLYSLASGMEQRVEVFTFGTRLTRITRQLKHKEADLAIDDVSSAVQDWSGGTRIGDILKSFNFEWSRRVLRGGAIVLIISDGWDRGDPELLGREMARLHRFCHRLIWLNPLLGSEQYEPLTRGMQAAIPYIDDFLAVHSLASLEELADHLLTIDTGGPRRKALRGAAFIGRNR